ncbi:hypothetical protein B0H13DRAFT_1888687 [Mycena leptocephala]|nr:hypothetical protein B0H13DRAFT_1888687 [Mycena leptocephala]
MPASYVSTRIRIANICKIDPKSFTEIGRASCEGESWAREKRKDARRGDAAADASSRAGRSGVFLSSSHCRLQERTDSLALSIYRQIHGPKLETLALSSFCELIFDERKEARVGAWVSAKWASSWGWSWRTVPDRRSAIGHHPLPCFLATCSSPTNARRCRRLMPEIAHTIYSSHWVFRPRTAGVRTLALVHASARPPSLTIRSLCHTPPTAPARAPTLLRMRLHALPQSRSDLAPCTIRLASAHPVFSCAPHSDPELDLVQLTAGYGVCETTGQSSSLSSCGSAFVFVSCIEYRISHMYHISTPIYPISRAGSAAGSIHSSLRFSTLRNLSPLPSKRAGKP